MFHRLFAMIALSCLSLQAQEISFCPLEENEYKNRAFQVSCVKLTKVLASELNKLPEKMKNQPYYFQDLIEISPGSHDILIKFRSNETGEELPSDTDPISFIIPAGFPFDAHDALMMGGHGFIEKEKFDCMKGNVLTGPNMEYLIGEWTSELSCSPKLLVALFNKALHDTRQDNITACCQKNKELVEKFNEFSHNIYKHINITIVKEFCRLLAFNFGGKVEDNPASGISAKVKIGFISKEFKTRGKSHKKRYKTYLGQELNDLVSTLGLVFDSQENVFKSKK